MMKIFSLRNSASPASDRPRHRVLQSVLFGIGALIVLALTAPSAFANSKYSSIIIDAESGKTLFSNHADSQRYPASLTKMMTLYMAFDALENGRLRKDTRLKVSRYAASRPPSKLGLKAGTTIRAEDVIFALVTKSANDAAAVLAEALGGSESRFSRLMTKKARALGMNQTVFRNASGLPNRKQVSTARDMATLGRQLFRDFPQYYHYFSTETFTYKGRKIGNHNNLLGVYDGTDGIKTGYINASGFNLVSSVRRNGYHLVGVVFGGKTARRRDAHMIDILDRAFKRLPGRLTPQRLAANEAPMPTIKPILPDTVQRFVMTIPRPKPVAIALAGSYSGTRKAADSIAALIASQTSTAPAPPTPNSIPVPRPAPPRVVSASASIANVPDQGSRSTLDVWGVQVGAFSEIHSARTHMLDLMNAYPEILSAAETTVLPYQSGGQTLFRARLEGFAEAQARGVCETLVASGRTCIPVPPNRG